MARNRGVEAAAGEFVAFLDGDALPHPQWLQRHVEALEQGGRESLLCGAEYSLPDLEYLQDPQRGTPMEDKTPSVVREYLRSHRPELILTEDMVLKAFDRVEARAVLGGYPFPELEILQEQIAELFVQHPDSPIGWLGFFPHNGVVSKEAFLEVGGFDPDMAFSEGWDLAYRLQQHGSRPRFVPEAKTYHLYHYHDFSDPLKACEETLRPPTGHAVHGAEIRGSQVAAISLLVRQYLAGSPPARRDVAKRLGRVSPCVRALAH